MVVFNFSNKTNERNLRFNVCLKGNYNFKIFDKKGKRIIILRIK